MNEADNRLFMNAFGCKVIFNLQNGEVLTLDSRGHALQGIFDIPFLNAEIGEFEIGSSLPRLSCISEDVVKVKKHDTAIIDGVEYNVVANPQADGEGTALIELGNKENA